MVSDGVGGCHCRAELGLLRKGVSISKKSLVFTGFFLGFLGFLRDCSTQAMTVLERSSLCMNVSILQTFVIYGVSEAQSCDLTCKNNSPLFPVFFVLRAFQNCT
jgi:hypothetical protein